MLKSYRAIYNDGILEWIDQNPLQGRLNVFVTVIDDSDSITPENSFNITDDYLDMSYRQMAADEKREAEALEWAESIIGDVKDEPR